MRSFFPSLLFLIVMTVLLFAVQHYIIVGLEDRYVFYYPVYAIYVFHFFVTLIIVTILFFLGRNFPRFVGFAFMGMILFKMVAAVVFLLPLIKMENVSKVPDFISFFAPYFLFLFVEVWIAVKILKQSEA